MSEIRLTSNVILPAVKLNRKSLYKLLDLCSDLFKDEHQPIFKAYYQEEGGDNYVEVTGIDLVKKKLIESNELHFIEIDVWDFNYNKKIQVEINRYYKEVVKIDFISDDEFWLTKASSVLKDFLFSKQIIYRSKFLFKKILGSTVITYLFFIPFAILVLLSVEFKASVMGFLFSVFMLSSMAGDSLSQKINKPLKSQLCFINKVEERNVIERVLCFLRDKVVEIIIGVCCGVLAYYITKFLDKS